MSIHIKSHIFASMTIRILFWMLLVPLFMACEDPNVRIDQLDAAIQGKFIDVDSLISIEADVERINNEISMVNDSLAVIDSLEIAGDQTDYTEEIEALNSALDLLQDERTILSERERAVSSGDILINAITATGAPKEMIFTESQSTYRLPLDSRSGTTVFEILYRGEIRTARFAYSTDTLFVNRTVRIIAKGILLTGTSYDSARFTCDTLECSSVNAKATFYM